MKLETGRRTPGQQGKIQFLTLVVIVALAAGMYSAYYMNRLYLEKELEIERLNEVVMRLEAESRLAQVLVKDQSVNPETGKLETTIKFMELTRDGENLLPRHFTVEGDVVYFDALVIKFDNDYVERGEALRGKSICLFRRIFGEYQKPDEGYPVDDRASNEGVPDVYRVKGEPSAFEVDLWKEFWRYAADPEEAKKKGVRVIQGEAVYNRLVRNNIYNLTLDHDGGININTETIPSILLDELKETD